MHGAKYPGTRLKQTPRTIVTYRWVIIIKKDGPVAVRRHRVIGWELKGEPLPNTYGRPFYRAHGCGRL